MSTTKRRATSKETAKRATASDETTRNTLDVPTEPNEDRDKKLARVSLSPAIQAMATTREFLKVSEGTLAVTALYDEIVRQSKRVKAGDLGRVEEMLFDQAQSLQAIFTALAHRAAVNAGEYINATDIYLRLALKAQAQCRATLETLAEIKNPRPTAFIRQQNIAANQQVNNGNGRHATTPTPVAGAGNPENQTNELSAVTHEQGQRLDFGAPGTAGAGQPAMAALDAIQRS